MGSVILTIMIIVWVVVTMQLKRMSKGNNAARRNSPSGSSGKWHTEIIPGLDFGKRAPRSTDGHTLKGEQDITCRQFGHHHPQWEEPTIRYIVHDDIEDGFIILNGKKMHRTEADAYENTI